MEALLIHPKIRDMCVSSSGLTDALFSEGWRMGYQDRFISDDNLSTYEQAGYTLTDVPNYNDFHIRYKNK